MYSNSKLKMLFISYVSTKSNQEQILPLPKLQSYRMLIALKRNKQVLDEGAILCYEPMKQSQKWGSSTEFFLLNDSGVSFR